MKIDLDFFYNFIDYIISNINTDGIVYYIFIPIPFIFILFLILGLKAKKLENEFQKIVLYYLCIILLMIYVSIILGALLNVIMFSICLPIFYLSLHSVKKQFFNELYKEKYVKNEIKLPKSLIFFEILLMYLISTVVHYIR